MTEHRDRLVGQSAEYYSGRLAEHGPNASGVDWNGPDSQHLRFEQLLQVIPDRSQPYSLLDWGCGYGALVDYLTARGEPVSWRGYDAAPSMVESCRQLHPDLDASQVTDSVSAVRPADFVVASGIFGVKGDTPDDEWMQLVSTELESIAASARHGFAVNFLTAWSDEDKKRPDLFYADPAVLMNHVRARFGRHVALLADYGLWEFTLLVRLGDVKPGSVRG